MELFGAGERIISEVLAWDRVALEQHRFGWTELRMDRRVFGHLHENSSVDILLPKPFRVDLVNSGEAEPHPKLPSSGWVTIYLQGPRDEKRALKVLRTAYDVIREQISPRFRHSVDVSSQFSVVRR